MLKIFYSVASDRFHVHLTNGGAEAKAQFRDRLAAESTSRSKNGAAFR
jgi:hypothetical protein